MASASVTFLAPAKLNLGLRVFARRTDGYHDIRSVMTPVTLYDEVAVSISDTPGIRIECDDPSVPCDGRNTAWKAVDAFRLWSGGDPAGVDLLIAKRIPNEAGMGGGSSDAAAVLKGLMHLTGKVPTDQELNRIAASVGADVPFFLCGGAALAEGIGDRLTRIPGFRAFHAVVVKPPFGLPTGEGYARLLRRIDSTPAEAGPDGSFDSWVAVRESIANDFEAAWGGDRPEISALKERLLREGAEAAAMTGSGSAVYGLFGDGAAARRAGEALSGEGLGRVFTVRTI